MPTVQTAIENNVSATIPVTDNAMALHQLLDQMASEAHHPRDKGTRFERLALDFFRHDRKYAGLFSLVETYSDWAKSHPELAADGRDIGIDLVATLDDCCNIYTSDGGGVIPYIKIYHRLQMQVPPLI